MKQLLIALALLAFIAIPTQAQEKEKIGGEEYFDLVEHPPTIIGGLESISKNLKYPEAAVRDSVQGTVYIEALVGVDGTVDKASVHKSDSDLLNEAALTAVKAIRFNPGRNKDVTVRTRVMIPIKFTLK